MLKREQGLKDKDTFRRDNRTIEPESEQVSRQQREEYLASQREPKKIRKVLVITRHGDTPVDAEGSSLDAVTPASVKKLHTQGKEDLAEIVRGHNVGPENTFIVGTGKSRTITTGLALASGLLESHKGPPKHEDELTGGNYDFVKWIDIQKRQGQIGYRGPKDTEGAMMNDEVYKAGKEGPAKVVDFWLQNREATEHTGKDKKGRDITARITPFTEVYRNAKEVVVESISELLDPTKNKHLGIIASHSTLVEAIATAIIESSGTRVNSVEDLGGQVAKGEYGKLIIDIDPNTRSYSAQFFLKDKVYDVDLHKLADINHNLHGAQDSTYLSPAQVRQYLEQRKQQKGRLEEREGVERNRLADTKNNQHSRREHHNKERPPAYKDN